MHQRLTAEGLSPAKAAAVLGVSTGTIYRRIRDQTLPAKRLGHLIIIPRKAVEKFLQTDSEKAA